MLNFISFCIMSVFTFASSSSKLNPDELAILKPIKESNTVLISDSECGSCQKLITELPSLCDLKPKSFDVFAVGNIKKNKKKLSSYEEDFSVYYSQKRSLLIKINTPATPAMLINQKHFVVGKREILKYFKKHSEHFCKSKTTDTKVSIVY